MKKQAIESVLNDWVLELPFTQQALLMLATRGPDGLPKETPAKKILHYLRGCVIKPAYENFEKCDGFMNVDYGEYVASEEFHSGYQGQIQGKTKEISFGWKFKEVMKDFFKDVDSYPLHFYMHLIHAAEVIGYHYHDDKIAYLWRDFYWTACKNFHMNPETDKQLNQRLNK